MSWLLARRQEGPREGESLVQKGTHGAVSHGLGLSAVLTDLSSVQLRKS